MFKFLVHIPLHELNGTYQRNYPEFDSQQQKKFFCHKIKGDDATEGSWFQIGLKLHLEDPSYIECSISQTAAGSLFAFCKTILGKFRIG